MTIILCEHLRGKSNQWSVVCRDWCEQREPAADERARALGVEGDAHRDNAGGNALGARCHLHCAGRKLATALRGPRDPPSVRRPAQPRLSSRKDGRQRRHSDPPLELLRLLCAVRKRTSLRGVRKQLDICR